MKFKDFEAVLSSSRLQRYVEACGGDTRKAMTLYRKNLHLSQDIFIIISCFEVALRNAIDRTLSNHIGNEWLRDSAMPGGFLDNRQCYKTCAIIRHAYNKRLRDCNYTHEQLLSDMEFGVWKYMFAPNEYRSSGRCLLSIFPYKPTSTAVTQYNNRYIFNELDKINTLRNRIAHHEPVCFGLNSATIDTTYVMQQYTRIQTLFQWMGVDSHDLLYGLDHVARVCQELRNL